MGRHVNYGGLIVAGVGFFLTRFTVTLAIYESAVGFYLAGVVPLALGLGLAAFGVALAVADVEPVVARTTAVWCVVGAGTMLVLVVLTLLGSSPDGMADFDTVRSQTYLSNFLIGGSVGGTLTGLYAARNRRQRSELQQQTHRLAVLNRLLRHEVLNAVTVIRGWATVDADDETDPSAVITEHSTAIEDTIDEVAYLTRSARTDETAREPTDLEECLAASVATVREMHPDADIRVDGATGESAESDDALTVRADERLEQVFTHLVENAVVHAGTAEPTVEVSVTATATRVAVAVTDDGPGLPENQQTLLESGSIERFDDPDAGFGLNVVRLLVERYGGTVETDVGAGVAESGEATGTTVTVELPRVQDDAPLRANQSASGVVGVKPSLPHLVVTLAAAVLAGVCYGLVAEQLGGSIAFIGVYYGVQDPVVGWLTHEFHSVVFGFAFAGLASLAPARYRENVGAYVGIGTAWGVALWFLAAGVVSPVWLRLLGFEASIPSVSLTILATHLVWGASLGLFTAWGDEQVVPWLARRWGQRGPSLE